MDYDSCAVDDGFNYITKIHINTFRFPLSLRDVDSLIQEISAVWDLCINYGFAFVEFLFLDNKFGGGDLIVW